jgi:hypothetical protein
MRARFVAALEEYARRASDHAKWELRQHEGLRMRATPLTNAADVAAASAAAEAEAGSAAADEAVSEEADAPPPPPDAPPPPDDAAGPSGAGPSGAGPSASAVSDPASASPARAPAPARRALSPPRSPPKAQLPASALVSRALAAQQPTPTCVLMLSGRACSSKADPRCDNGACGPSHCRLLQQNHGYFPCTRHLAMTPPGGPFPPLRATSGGA